MSCFFDKNRIKYLVTAIVAAILVALCLSVSSQKNEAFAFVNSDEAQAQVNELISKTDTIQTKINENKKTIEDTTYKREHALQLREEAQQRYNEAEEKIADLRPELEEKSKNSYAALLAIELLNHMVGNEQISSSIFQWEFIKFIAGNDENLVRETMDSYYDKKEAYEEMSKNDNTASEELEKAQKAREDLEKAKEEMAAELNVKNTELQGMLEIEKQYGKCGNPKIVGKGEFCHPCPDFTALSSKFDEDRPAGDTGGPKHKGVDFAAKTGTPIYAAADGTVITATYTDDFNYGNGMWVVISHGNGLVTKYKHCSHVFVPIGTAVHKGDNIALVGNTGESYGSHLHFQVEKDNIAVDPMPYLKDKEQQ